VGENRGKKKRTRKHIFIKGAGDDRNQYSGKRTPQSTGKAKARLLECQKGRDRKKEKGRLHLSLTPGMDVQEYDGEK